VLCVNEGARKKYEVTYDNNRERKTVDEKNKIIVT
jgi:hypothetical protein